MLSALFLFLALFHKSLALSGQLVGSGAVTRHGGAGRRSGGWVTVDKYAVGFHIAGSSVAELNGLYEKVGPRLSHLCYDADMAWENQISGWYLIAGAKVEGHEDTWHLIDSEGYDRFKCPGGSWMPKFGGEWSIVHDEPKCGPMKAQAIAQARADMLDFHEWTAGDKGVVTGVQPNDKTHPLKWRRDYDGMEFSVQRYTLNRPSPTPDDSTSKQIATMEKRKLTQHEKDQLPWQIVGIGGEEKLNELRDMYQKRAQRARAMLRRQRRCSREEQKDFFDQAYMLLNGTGRPSAKAAQIPKDGAIQRCRALLAIPFLENLLRCNRTFESQAPDEHTGAVVPTTNPDTQQHQKPDTSIGYWLVQAHTRARRCPGERGPVVDGYSVGDRIVFPDTVPGFWSKGEGAKIVGLGQPDSPLATLTDRGRFIDVQTSRVVLANDINDGQRRNAEDQSQTLRVKPDYYELLGISSHFKESELKKAYRLASLQLHPDKPGGSKSVFQHISEANAVLSEMHLKKKYDRGDDLITEQPFSLYDELMRFYFPEKSDFQPFGDPKEDRRRYEQRQQEEEERAQRQQESQDFHERAAGYEDEL